MADGRMSPQEAANLAARIRELNDQLGKTKSSFSDITKNQREQIILEQQRSNIQEAINELQKEQIEGNEDLSDGLTDLLKQKGALLDAEKKITEEGKKGNKWVQARVGFFKELNREIQIGWKYLQESDKVIRQTILNLGMSGAKAEMMRASFEASAGYVARLGGNMEDIRDMMTTFADRTGRARVLTGEMVEQIAQMGKGTAIGIENATLLAAQFEYMGVDVAKTMDYVQGVVDTSERMGVNTTKVLKNINDNFKKLNTYTFRQGVSGLAEMATYAEKFRVDITEALSAADVARSLEGAIDLAAQLQIMGGEFAKTDPFEMLFLARNDPAEFTKKISEMTRGVVTFRKMADGSFEKFISPADRDRLRNVAQSLGMSVEEITEIAQRRAEMDKMAQQMQGMGLSTREKELIEGAATFDSKSGRFMVQIGDQMKDITNMNAQQARTLVTEISTLEERAKAAQTFEDALKATIEELKAGLLPLLRGINKILSAVRPVVEKFVNAIGNIDSILLRTLAIAGTFMGAVGLLKVAGGVWQGITNKLSGVGSRLVGGGAGGSRLLGGAVGEVPAGQPGSMFTKTGMIRKGAGKLTLARGGAAGLGGLGKGLGAGAAMVGAGAGVNIAAQGISKLADAMSRLTPEQAESLAKIVKSLSWFAVGAAAAAVGIVALGGAGTAAAVGLLAFGAAMVGIGFGINLATKGIGFMAEGLAKLVEAGGEAGPTFKDVGAGIAMITAAMVGMNFGGGIGIAKFAALLKILKKNQETVDAVAASFKGVGAGIESFVKLPEAISQISNIDTSALNNIKTVLSGSVQDFREIRKAIDSISNVKVKGGSAIGELANLLRSPLKVEFADKQVALVSNITLEIDGQKFHQATKTGAYVRNNYNDAKTGKETS